MNQIKINYIKFSFSSSLPDSHFIENNFVKKSGVYIGQMDLNGIFYKCTLMKNLCYVNFTGVKCISHIQDIVNFYCKKAKCTRESKVQIDSIFSTINNININLNNFEKLNDYLKINKGYIKLYPTFSGIYFKFNNINGCGIYFKKSKKINLLGQKNIHNIKEFINILNKANNLSD